MFAKLNQSLLLNMPQHERCSPSSACILNVKSFFPFSSQLFLPVAFSLKAQKQLVVSEGMLALPTNSLSLLYNRSLEGKLSLSVWWRELNVGGMEGLEQEGRANRSVGAHMRAGEFLRGNLLNKNLNTFHHFHICGGSVLVYLYNTVWMLPLIR